MFVSRLKTAYSPETSFAGLNTAELFVVSSLRLWFLPHCDPKAHYPDWREGFVRARIDTQGAMGFDTLCCIVGTSALRTFEVHTLCYPKLSTDEAWMLQAIGLLQDNQLSRADALLTENCPPSASRLALSPARAFAFALRTRRLRISFDYPQIVIRSSAPAVSAFSSPTLGARALATRTRELH